MKRPKIQPAPQVPRTRPAPQAPRIGRPPHGAETMHGRFTIRLTDAERAEYKRKANGQALSEWIRDTATASAMKELKRKKDAQSKAILARLKKQLEKRH